MRPALVAVGFRAVSARASLELAFEAGVSLELLQAYFLIHDDWMDRDELRRGGPTVHVRLAGKFQDAHLGAASAILAGDYGAALALERLTHLRLAPARLRPALEAFSRMQSAAVLGQQLDVIGKARDVELVYRLKTASYTVRGPLELGAVLAGGSARELRVLGAIAEPLGVAFQLQDDLLGAFGDPKVTGKPLGNDLTAGKRTQLLVEARRRLRGERRALLDRVAGNARASRRDVTNALALLEACGAKASVEARIQTLSAEALSAARSGLTPLGRSLIEGAVQALTQRRH